jgi:hypothetical protein
MVSHGAQFAPELMPGPAWWPENIIWRNFNYLNHSQAYHKHKKYKKVKKVEFPQKLNV